MKITATTTPTQIAAQYNVTELRQWIKSQFDGGTRSYANTYDREADEELAITAGMVNKANKAELVRLAFMLVQDVQAVMAQDKAAEQEAKEAQLAIDWGTGSNLRSTLQGMADKLDELANEASENLDAKMKELGEKGASAMLYEMEWRYISHKETMLKASMHRRFADAFYGIIEDSSRTFESIQSSMMNSAESCMQRVLDFTMNSNAAVSYTHLTLPTKA